MSATLTVAVAGLTSVATLNNTDQQVGNIIKYFLADKVMPPDSSLTQTQQNQYYLDATKTELVRYIRQEAYKNRLRQLNAAGTNEAQATGETTL